MSLTVNMLDFFCCPLICTFVWGDTNFDLLTSPGNRYLSGVSRPRDRRVGLDEHFFKIFFSAIIVLIYFAKLIVIELEEDKCSIAWATYLKYNTYGHG